ncbi:MAG: hypothetical protein AB1451_05870 [Nitrospirota bacterium]
MTGSSTTGDAGFSLIDTLAALGLLAIGVAAVTTGFTEGHRLADEVGRRQRAIVLAQDKLAEKLSVSDNAIMLPSEMGERVEAGVLLGEDQVNGVSRRWVVEPDFPAPGLFRVWVTTRWTQRSVAHVFQVAGVRGEGLVP